MITETKLHTFGDGCYVRQDIGTQPWDNKVTYGIMCNQHRDTVEKEVAELTVDMAVKDLA